MITNILNLFDQICAIPHGSSDNAKLKNYLVKYLENIENATIKVDNFGNIYAKKGTPKICLQGHYDMVCVGNATNKQGIKTQIKDGYLCAIDSSLGADNGIAIASMLECMRVYNDIEILMTNDEEIGMIGANNIEIDIQSNILLNLDSEHIEEIILGCAGGMDAKINFDLDKANFSGSIYEIKSSGFVGGHSGIDIDKNIENAIKNFGKFLESFSNTQIAIARIQAGEKRNSIPVNLQALIMIDKKIENIDMYAQKYGFICKSINETNEIFYNASKLKNIINIIHSGVYNVHNYNIINSLNMSLLNSTNDNFEMELMLRANRDDMMRDNVIMLQNISSLLDAKIEFSDKYPSWEPNITDKDEILESLKNIYKNLGINVKTKEIHAGLECGILLERFRILGNQKKIKAISIGPTIDFPHSVNERLEIESFYKFVDILESILKEIKCVK